MAIQTGKPAERSPKISRFNANLRTIVVRHRSKTTLFVGTWESCLDDFLFQCFRLLRLIDTVPFMVARISVLAHLCTNSVAGRFVFALFPVVASSFSDRLFGLKLISHHSRSGLQ